MGSDIPTITPENDIWLDEDALRDHFPDRILERDEKLAEYLNAFSEVVRNKRPRNVFVYGLTGVGKTIGTKAVLDRLHDSINDYNYDSTTEFEEPSLRTLYVECEGLNSSYQVAGKLINCFRRERGGSTIKVTGYPESEMYEMLFDEIRAIDESHLIVALDEIDNIGEDDSILYKLPRANDDDDDQVNKIDPSNTKVGVVGITNDSTFKDHLDPRARSTLCDKEVHFPEYNARELRTILEDRAGQAFKDGVLTDDVVPLTAAFATQQSGYARTALDLLYEAGSIADERGASRVTEEHVRAAEDRLQQGAIVPEIKGLQKHPTLLTYALLRLHDEGELPAKLDKVYAWYETAADRAGVDTVTSRTIHNTLNDLMMNGIVQSSEVNKGRGGGRHYEYSLGVSGDLVLAGLSGTSNLDFDRTYDI